MNKAIRGELLTLQNLAEEAQNYLNDPDLVEQFVLNMAPHWHKLCYLVNATRPETGNWLDDQLQSVHFRTMVKTERDRPVVNSRKLR